MSRTTETKANARAPRPKSTPHGIGSAISSSREADAMHAELLAQCEALMSARKGTKAARDLDRISKLVADYESVRWPF